MPSLSEWVTYTRWNAALAAEFFSGRYGGRPVYIDLESDALNRIARAIGLEHDGDIEERLISAVVPTLGLADRASLFGAHVRRLRTWRTGERDLPPPIVAVLALQSVVAEGMRSDEDLRASNYYGRFMQAVGRDPGDPSFRQKVIRGFDADSAELWTALNQWIEEDGETRGIPTAYSFDYRVHVGLPMSQALVRASDRDAIRTLFSELELRPGQSIALEDMERLLSTWLPDSRLSRGLKILCAKESALRRVAEVACVELQAWSGTVGDAPTSRRSIALTAGLRRLPKRALRIGLSIRVPEDVEGLWLDPGSGDAASAALAGSVGEVLLGQPDEEDWRPVLSELSVPDLLLAHLRLSSGSLRATRDPRTLIVLARPSGGGPFRETDRVRLGSSHLLLAVEPIRERVERELVKIARPGFRVHTSMPGLPAGWVVIEGVEIVVISETRSPDLSSLVPLAWTEVAVEGGLKLPGRATWHARSTPEIRATAPAGREIALAILREDPPDTDDVGQPAESNAPGSASSATGPDIFQFEEATVIDLSSIGLRDGDYRVQLFDGDLSGRTLGATTLHLRSSDSPLLPVVRATFAYALQAPLGALSAEPGADGVQGALLPDLATLDEEMASSHALASQLIGREVPPEQDDPEPPYGLERQSTAPACFTTGAHHFVLESVPRGRRGWEQAFEGECKHCGLEKSFPARPRRRGAAQGAARRLSGAASAPSVPAVREQEALDHDVLLDALCCIGAGTFSAMQQLVSQSDDRPWAAHELARTLVSLGYLDVNLDEQLRPRSWSISPTTLVASPHQTFIAGWRSPKLVACLNDAVQAVGGRIVQTQQDDGPSRVTVSDVDRGQLDDIAAELSKRGGVPVAVSRDAPRRLARALPRLASIRQELATATLPAGGRLDRLDPVSMRWTATSAASRPGAYRTGGLPRIVIHSDGRDSRVTDSRLAKWLAVDGTSLLAHDPARMRVICHRGAEPPWLYERALVLCSGLLPKPLEGHLVEYADVDQSVAAALAARLAPGVQVHA
jgi:hypothetical protein